MKLNFEGLEMQKWNIPTDRAQRVDGKNGVFCVVIMFTSQVMVIKKSKMAHFLYFLLMPAKKSVTVWTKYLCASERFYLALSENAMDFGFLATINKISTLEDTEFYFFCWLSNFLIFLPSIYHKR